MENCKLSKTAPRCGKYATLGFNSKVFKLRNDQLTLSWSGAGRFQTIIKIPKYHQDYIDQYNLETKFCTVKYNEKKDMLQVNMVFSGAKPKALPVKNVLGIDRGVYNLATLSNSANFSSEKIRRRKDEFRKIRSSLQAKGTRSAKRRLKALGQKEKRFSQNQNHIISKTIVNLPFEVFALENLKGMRRKYRGKLLNTWLSNWSYYQLETQITYKAMALGKQVVKVDAKYTSQECSSCGEIDKKNRVKAAFCCTKCGYKAHADHNAALNIRKRGEAMLLNAGLTASLSQNWGAASAAPSNSETDAVVKQLNVVGNPMTSPCL